MRKTIIFTSQLLFLLSNAFTQNVQISDPNFKICLLENLELNLNGDNEIQLSEAQAYNGEIHCREMEITSIEGIEEFPNIFGIDFSKNMLTEIDLSNQFKIGYINVGFNEISSLKINPLESVYQILCYGNQLDSFDTSVFPELRIYNCSRNLLTKLDLSKNDNITHLTCSNNNLNKIDISNLSGLLSLSATDALLQEIDLSNNPLLGNVLLDRNMISEIDLSQNPNIYKLYLGTNNISNFDFSNNQKIRQLRVSFNKLETIDLSDIDSLSELSVIGNSLSELDLSAFNKLEYLWVGKNNFEQLDVSNNSNLLTLACQENLISCLDITNNPKIELLDTRDNNLVSLNLANGNNDLLSNFNVSQNPNLNCIKVDSTIGTIKPLHWITDDSLNISPECIISFALDEFEIQPACTVFSEDGIAIPNVTCGQGPFTYRLNNETTTLDELMSLRSGNFEILAIDDLGQEVKQEINIPHLYSLSSDSILNQGESKYELIKCLTDGPLNLKIETLQSDSLTFLWSTGETTQEIFIDPQIATSYCVLITNSDGSNCQLCIDVIIEENCTTSSSETSNQLLRIYPNPTKDIIQIETELIQSIYFQIYNTTGILLLESSPKKLSNSIDVSQLPSGTYFIRIINGNHFATKKFIKL